MFECVECGFKNLDPMTTIGAYPQLWTCAKCNHVHKIFRDLTIKDYD